MPQHRSGGAFTPLLASNGLVLAGAAATTYMWARRAGLSWTPSLSTSQHHAMAKTVTPEKAARLWRDSHYLNQLWWAIAAFIALVAVCQFVSWVVSRLRARRAPPMTEKGAAQAEAGGSRAVTRRFSWRNIPSAIVNAYRVIAFRWTLNIGDEYTLNMAEVVITCLYIVALFTWEFYNSEYSVIVSARLGFANGASSYQPDHWQKV